MNLPFTSQAESYNYTKPMVNVIVFTNKYLFNIILFILNIA